MGWRGGHRSPAHLLAGWPPTPRGRGFPQGRSPCSLEQKRAVGPSCRLCRCECLIRSPVGASSLSSFHLEDGLTSGNEPTPSPRPHSLAWVWESQKEGRAPWPSQPGWRPLLAHPRASSSPCSNSEGFPNQGRTSPGSRPETNGGLDAQLSPSLQGRLTVPPPCTEPRIGGPGGAGGM